MSEAVNSYFCDTAQFMFNHVTYQPDQIKRGFTHSKGLDLRAHLCSLIRPEDFIVLYLP